MSEVQASPQPKFEQWAIVELMGRQIVAGKVTEQVVAGHGFLRVDVPEVEIVKSIYVPFGSPPKEEKQIRQGYTRYINPSSLYALNPCSEEVARAAAASYRVADPMPLEFKPDRMLAAAPSGDGDNHEDEET